MARSVRTSRQLSCERPPRRSSNHHGPLRYETRSSLPHGSTALVRATAPKGLEPSRPAPCERVDSSRAGPKAPQLLSEWQTSHHFPSPNHLGPQATRLDRERPWQTSHRSLRSSCSARSTGTVDGTRGECSERIKHSQQYGQVSTEPTFAKQKPVRRSPAPQLCSTRSVHTSSCISNY